MRSLVSTFLCVLISISWTQPSRAQSPVRFGVTPGVGLYSSVGALGPVAPDDGGRHLRLDRFGPILSFQVSAEATWPERQFSIRLLGILGRPTDVSGQMDCYPGVCAAIGNWIDARTTVWTAVADLVYRGFAQRGPLRPFAVLGVGVKRYHFSWPGGGSHWAGGDHAETRIPLHAAVGADLKIAGAPIRVEIGDYWTSEGDRFQGPGSSGTSYRRPAQHDLAISLGWRLLGF